MTAKLSEVFERYGSGLNDVFERYGSGLNEVFERYCLSSPRSSEGSTLDSLDNDETTPAPKDNGPVFKFSTSSRNFWKGFLGAFAISMIFLARFNIPNNQIEKLEDKILNAFQFMNDWIHEHENEPIRAFFQFACGFQIDLIFFMTGIYWLKHTHNGRLPFSVFVFYLVRAIVQGFFWVPFPDGFYWESPGFPSLVAPYGRGSDFFFSGHSGFLVLMALEWHKVGKKRMRNYCLVNLVYTIMVLLVYQIHYSIDIFTGVFFADYVFTKVDMNLEAVDTFFKRIVFNVEKFAKGGKNLVLGAFRKPSKRVKVTEKRD